MCKKQINIRVPADILAKLTLAEKSSTAGVLTALIERINEVGDVKPFSELVAKAGRLENMASRLLWLRLYLPVDTTSPNDKDLIIFAKSAQDEALRLLAEIEVCAQTIAELLAKILDASHQTDLYALRREVQALASRTLLNHDDSEHLALPTLVGLLLFIMGAFAVDARQLSRVLDLAIKQHHLRGDRLPGLPETPEWPGKKDLSNAPRFHLTLSKEIAVTFCTLVKTLGCSANRLALELLDCPASAARDYVCFTYLASTAKLTIAAEMSLRGFHAETERCKYELPTPTVLLDPHIVAADKCMPKISALPRLVAAIGWAYSPRHRAALEPLLSNISFLLNQKPVLSANIQALIDFMRLVRILPNISPDV